MSKKRSSQKLWGGERDEEEEFEWVSIIANGKLTFLASGLCTPSRPLTHIHTCSHILTFPGESEEQFPVLILMET